VADSGYGSEENYEFMQDNDIEPFVKFNYFHKEQKRAFKKNGFLSQNLYYNSEEDYYVCPMGQHMDKVGKKKNKTASGYTSTSTLYEAKNCNGCPLKCLCTKAKGNRRIEVNHNLIAFNIGKLHLKGLDNKGIWAFLGKYDQKGDVILFLVKIGVNFKSFSSVNNYNQKTAA